MVHGQIRSQTTSAGEASPRSKISPFLTLLLCAGLGATAYGVYDIYGTMTMWPPEIRGDLRGGLAAKYRGDLELCEQYLRRAWETSKTLPLEVFKSQPHLKTSGIAVCLAGVLESNNKLEEAYAIYLESLTRLQDVGTKERLSGPEKLRAVAISYRLGELAATLEKPEDVERHLVWAVEAILKSIMHDKPNGGDSTPVPSAQLVSGSQVGDSDTQTMITELELPTWATKTDIAAPFEALGTFYSQAGKFDYAMPLYLQAISVLIPPPPQYSSVEDRCRGAQLMTNLSELIIRSHHSLSSKALHQAEMWATKALDVAMNSKESTSIQQPTCEIAFAVALFNIAALRRMAGDQEKAKEYFTLSLNQSRAIGMQAGIIHAEDALHQLNSQETSPH
ncbi:hypothetical protein BDZ94DRAFT_1172522 [Collybia nuda]|uniref:Uncharacterized protein n=1 Tax=Collybia nuda TaxID=64659 RepID=A0A9P5XYL8_9AGAR|nr:hypothetical protein BDZ94DRAFT_1172522 [Collybia nuda]